MICHFCKTNVSKSAGSEFGASSTLYDCPVCGYVNLTYEAASTIESQLSNEQKLIISIVLRSKFENRGRKSVKSPLNLFELYQFAKTYQPLDPIEKMDNALIILDKKSKYVGQALSVDITQDFSYYHCFATEELHNLLLLLYKEGYIEAQDPHSPHDKLSLVTKGYQRLRELKRTSDSKTCFVAMWFTPEMQEVYLQAVQPAIEFIEEGQTEPKYRAVKIDTHEHINDINDEIIAQIRRSRFMVCDLTGYRGGVYFEAGFAYGLGLDVIYTCREDWSKEEILKDAEGEPVEKLYDSKGVPIPVRKEGVHFDLAHRNRIEWTMDDLPGFKKQLENRIKAVII